jgi:hypothetical protein
MKTLCYSVRLSSLTSISEKAYKAEAFDGSEAIIPKSQVFGQDYDVQKSDAYWVSAWILEQKSLQYSAKKEAWFDKSTGKMLPSYSVKKHTPELKEKLESNELDSLKR